MTPLLKRSMLEKEDLKNYCPISNLPFVLKRIEKVVVARRIEEHLEHNDLHDSYQSACSRYYSTETTLSKVQCDIAVTLDEGSITEIIMLDLYAAFDYSILLKSVEFSFPLEFSFYGQIITLYILNQWLKLLNK